MNAQQQSDRRYAALRLIIEKEADFPVGAPYDAYDLVAHCVYKSMTVETYCTCDSSYVQELAKIRQSVDIELPRFTEAIRIKSGPRRRHLPKFHFKSQWYESVNANSSSMARNEIEAVVFSCTFGLAALPVAEICRGLDSNEWLTMLDAFNADVPFQIRCLAALYCRVWKLHQLPIEEVLARVGERIGEENPIRFAEKVQGLAESLRGGISAP